jgi:hypothetical protein
VRQSALLGDTRLGAEIAEQLLKHALDNERRTEALELMLSLVYPMELLGDVVKAGGLLTRGSDWRWTLVKRKGIE